MIVLGPDEIARLLPMGKAIAAMRSAFAAHAEGRVQAPHRTVLHTGGERGATLIMPAALESEGPPHLVLKVVSVFPGNARRGLRVIHGTVLAIDAGTGVPLALMDGASLTAIRTAAGCGLATQLLARPESRVLAVFGSGVHARTQVRAVCAVRPISDIRIFNPNAASARAMAEELAQSAPVTPRAVRSAEEALDGADVASLATTSRVPVLEDSCVRDGIHINAIGSFHPGDRELPSATVARARVVVDDRESALEEAGDILIPISEGLFGADHIDCDLGSLVLGRRAGRRREDRVTLFKSVGLAAQDAAAARAVLLEARERKGLPRIDW